MESLTSILKYFVLWLVDLKVFKCLNERIRKSLTDEEYLTVTAADFQLIYMIHILKYSHPSHNPKSKQVKSKFGDFISLKQKESQF